MLTYREGEKESNHRPKIECPDAVKAGEEFQLRVFVEGHPNKVDHSIRWIEVYFEEEGRDFNPVMVARAAFSELANPDLMLKIRLEKGGKFVAIAYCNKHGLWENEKEVSVS